MESLVNSCWHGQVEEHKGACGLFLLPHASLSLIIAAERAKLWQPADNEHMHWQSTH